MAQIQYGAKPDISKKAGALKSGISVAVTPRIAANTHARKLMS